MAITIGSNIASLLAQRRLGESSSALGSVFERLSSGQRINKASDDAAGLSIAMNLNVSARIATQGIRNINDGISAIGIAEGALTQMSSIATRQKELATQAANGTLSREQRQALQNEANALAQEFNRIVQVTSFNGRRLLDATNDSIRIQLGEGINGSIEQGFAQGLKRYVGTGTFTLSASNTIGQTENGVAYDANGDGNVDIVSLLGGGAAVHVQLGNGNGTFRAGRTYQVGIVSPNDMIIGDFNKDGVVDVATVSEASQSVIVMIGNSDGSFNAASTFSVAGATDLRRIEVGDVNNDGNLDLVSISDADNLWAVSLGNSNGSFSAGVVYTGTDILDQDFVINDINGDGNADVVMSVGDFATAEYAKIFYGNGNGSFSAGVTLDATGTSSAAIAVADFNRDGRMDIISNLSGSNQSAIYLNNGDGTFSRSNSPYNSAGGGRMEIADMNGDGFDDVINAIFTGANTNLMLGNGDGTFKAYRVIASLASDNSAYAADFNNDGVLDVANFSNGGTMTAYLQSKEASSTIAELNLATQAKAREALAITDTTLQRISSGLGYLGSFQSRLGFAMKTLQISHENLRSASSRIMDADIATESASLARLNILQQAGAAVLAQANIQPQLALKLLS